MKDMAEREATGESFWTEGFNERVRSRIAHAYARLVDIITAPYGDPAAVFTTARQMILEQGGEKFLQDSNASPYRDFKLFLESSPDDMYPTALEALLLSVDQYEASWRGAQYIAGQFAESINEVFAQERVAWKIIDGQMIEMKSMEMHAAVVEPAIRLLQDPRYSKVDATYRKALDEISKGDGADAVTDAGTALQELLTALGCDGNQLGDLVRSARKKQLLASHDTAMLDVIEKAMHWVAADRSETGESHHASDASRDDAWLIVHIVGALIVRLASGEKRPSA